MFMRIRTFGLSCSLVLAILAVGPLARPAAALDIQPTTTIFLPNIVKMLGGDDGWNTPFIVQNVGSGAADLAFDFYLFQRRRADQDA